MNLEDKREKLFNQWLEEKSNVEIPDGFAARVMGQIENDEKRSSWEEKLLLGWQHLVASWSSLSAVMACGLLLGFLRAAAALLFILVTSGEGF